MNLQKGIKFFFLLLVTSIAFSPMAGREKAAIFRVFDLRSEYQVNPIGIDVSPRLSWRVLSNHRGFSQEAYQVIVASSLNKLNVENADVWNSGRVVSSQSVGIAIYNKVMQSRQRYYWKVRVWKNSREVSDWSAPAYFEMGLLSSDDWKSGWIGYVPGMPGRVLYFKGTFTPRMAIKQARAYVSGLGFYELYINHKKVGDHVLDPAQSTYSKRVYYVTYDVSRYFNQTANSIVVPVAPGWLGTPRLRMQIEVTYQDNTTEILNSDRFRSVIGGPIISSTIFDGENYDARLDTDKLYAPGIPQGLMNEEWAWAHNTDDPTGKMVAQKIEPIRVVEEITPILKQELRPGIYVFDAGRNLAGWVALKVNGQKGTKVSIRYAETLYKDGTVNQENLRNAKSTDTYILKGDGMERWEPAFTYHGFRYFQIEGLSDKPRTGDITVKVVRTDVAKTGTFECSNPLLNSIQKMVVNTEASNLHSVPTDCPQRDERMGWLNDLTVRIEQAIYNFNLSRFYPKFIDDIQDTQDEKGTITCVAPFRFGMRPADPVSASYLLLAQKCYEFYGDRRIISEHFDGMKAWVDYLYSRTKDGIVDYSYYGDWCPPREFLADPNGSGVSKDTPGRMISTGYLYLCSKLLSDMAKILNKQDIAVRYAHIADETAKAINHHYWNEEIGGYASNNQASNSFALYLGIVDTTRIPRVVNNLVNDVKKHDYHLTTGNLCTKYLLEMLTEHGHVDVAYKIAAQSTYPSWGFMLKNGATTLWERWEFLTGDAMNSHNHPMMGSIGSWFYKYLLGIVPESAHPGFEEFVIKPYIPRELTFAKGSLETVKGTIKVSWKKEENILTMDITIPENTKAKVYIPTKDKKTITEGNRNISLVKEITWLPKIGDDVVLLVPSGNYHFKCKQ